MSVFTANPANPYARARTTASDTESVITTHTTPGTSYSVYSGEEPTTGGQENALIQDGLAHMNVNRRRNGRAVSALEVPSARIGQSKQINLRCPHCNAETRTLSELK